MTNFLRCRYCDYELGQAPKCPECGLEVGGPASAAEVLVVSDGLWARQLIRGLRLLELAYAEMALLVAIVVGTTVCMQVLDLFAMTNTVWWLSLAATPLYGGLVLLASGTLILGVRGVTSRTMHGKGMFSRYGVVYNIASVTLPCSAVLSILRTWTTSSSTEAVLLVRGMLLVSVIAVAMFVDEVSRLSESTSASRPQNSWHTWRWCIVATVGTVLCIAICEHSGVFLVRTREDAACVRGCVSVRYFRMGNKISAKDSSVAGDAGKKASGSAGIRMIS